MRVALLLLAALLGGCAINGSCVWGGGTQAEADKCAEKNFGGAGAAEIKKREARCRECGTVYGETIGATPQYCALNCPAGNE